MRQVWQFEPVVAKAVIVLQPKRMGVVWMTTRGRYEAPFPVHRCDGHCSRDDVENIKSPAIQDGMTWPCPVYRMGLRHRNRMTKLFAGCLGADNGNRVQWTCVPSLSTLYPAAVGHIALK